MVKIGKIETFPYGPIAFGIHWNEVLDLSKFDFDCFRILILWIDEFCEWEWLFELVYVQIVYVLIVWSLKFWYFDVAVVVDVNWRFRCMWYTFFRF